MVKNDDITSAILLTHMRGMEHRLHKEMRVVESNLRKEMHSGFIMINDRLKALEWEELPRRVSRLEDKVFTGVDS